MISKRCWVKVEWLNKNSDCPRILEVTEGYDSTELKRSLESHSCNEVVQIYDYQPVQQYLILAISRPPKEEPEPYLMLILSKTLILGNDNMYIMHVFPPVIQNEEIFEIVRTSCFRHAYEVNGTLYFVENRRRNSILKTLLGIFSAYSSNVTNDEINLSLVMHSFEN